MTKTTKTDTLSRRKLLGRIGVLAAASYTVPAFTTLSMARASTPSSSASAPSASASAPSASASATSPSASTPSASTPSHDASTGGGTTGPTPLEVCGPENLDDPNYLQCLVDNGFS